MENQNITKFPRYERYKDSGVDWLEQIPESWKIWRLFSLAKIKSITNCEDEDLLSVYLNLGVVKFSDIDEKRTNGTSETLEKYQLVEPGDFVLNNQQAWRGSVGVSAFRGIISPAYLVLQLSKLITPLFANYLFRDQIMVSQYLIGSRGVGTIQRNLYWDKLKKTEVLLPPLPEQTAIAQFLDHKTAQIDRAIAIKEEQIKLLNERKQIMIQEAVTKGLDPTVRMKDSGVEWIGEIPEHWEVKALKFLCTLAGRIGFRGYSQSDIVAEGEGALVLGPSNIRGLLCDFKERRYLSWKKYYESPEIMIDDKDLLLVKTGSTYGKIALVTSVNEPMTINPQMVLLKSIKINPSFVNFLLNSLVYQARIKTLNTGSGMPTMTQSNIGNIKILIPDLDEQELISTYIIQKMKSIDNVIENNLISIDKIKEYKTTLINEAVTGKIKVN